MPTRALYTSERGLGVNSRTGKYVGGGAAIGAVMGALLGGGKGAVGARVGGARGAGTQVYTGRKKEVPAETELSFKLAQNRIRPGEYMVDGERGVGQAMGFGRRRRRLA